MGGSVFKLSTKAVFVVTDVDTLNVKESHDENDDQISIYFTLRYIVGGYFFYTCICATAAKATIGLTAVRHAIGISVGINIRNQLWDDQHDLRHHIGYCR